MSRVYFIKPIGMGGPIKIGCSVSPDRRRETLETWCPFPLQVVAEIEGGFHLERRFHSAFASDFIKHEWFTRSERLIATIEAINAGTFDIETLPQPLSQTAFRKPRNNAYATPSWRYEASVKARFRTRLGKWPWSDREFLSLVPAGCHDLLPYREQIEELIKRRTVRKPVA